MKASVLARAEEFAVELQAYCNIKRRIDFPSLQDVTIEVKPGRKNIKIVRIDGQTMVHCFIDAETGDIYKAASWNAPAKHARGNIFDDGFGIGTAVNEYGAAYLK